MVAQRGFRQSSPRLPIRPILISPIAQRHFIRFSPSECDVHSYFHSGLDPNPSGPDAGPSLSDCPNQARPCRGSPVQLPLIAPRCFLAPKQSIRRSRRHLAQACDSPPRPDTSLSSPDLFSRARPPQGRPNKVPIPTPSCFRLPANLLVLPLPIAISIRPPVPRLPKTVPLHQFLLTSPDQHSPKNTFILTQIFPAGGSVCPFIGTSRQHP